MICASPLSGCSPVIPLHCPELHSLVYRLRRLPDRRILGHIGLRLRLLNEWKNLTAHWSKLRFQKTKVGCKKSRDNYYEGQLRMRSFGLHINQITFTLDLTGNTMGIFFFPRCIRKSLARLKLLKLWRFKKLVALTFFKSFISGVYSLMPPIQHFGSRIAKYQVCRDNWHANITDRRLRSRIPDKWFQIPKWSQHKQFGITVWREGVACHSAIKKYCW
jgi:hypothetical protein